MNPAETDSMPSAPPAARTPGIAIVSFILGLLAFPFSILMGIPALICGHIALSNIKRSRVRLNGKGLAVTGLVLGYLSFVWFVGLAALLIPGVTASMNAAKKAEAATEAFNVKNAIGSYFTEYRRYPVPEEETMEAGYLTDELIMNALVGESTDLNPRGIVFFSGKEARPLDGDDSGTKFKAGLSEEGGNTRLWDPWGNHYRIGLDLNRDYSVRGPHGVDVQDSVIVWSAGPDGADGTADDVKPW